ncbi:hypothetical protein P3W43_01330 [Salinicola salarius]|uniref:hypothetical protein n=1 Tax=Salinicola salarius TaxID=430457 RepID=UPI0023E3F635|nr:hypothetical protein [Salinicola salarius]MDF3917491.1 hypothetical protein [Salinicola salarius]
MSDNRHPSRDALLRDGFGQLREQRGVSLESFAFTLNALVHAMAPAKSDKMPNLSSLGGLNAESMRTIESWRKRCERWVDGGTELPAWLEEPFVTALEEHGDTDTRVQLARRHGFMGVRRPALGDAPACAFAALGSVGRETGDVMGVVSEMLQDGVLDENDRQYGEQALTDIDDAVAALMSMRALIQERVMGARPALRSVNQ